MKAKNYLITALVSAIVSLLVIMIYMMTAGVRNDNQATANDTMSANTDIIRTGFSGNNTASLPDFTLAVDKTLDAVVHVKTSYMAQTAPSFIDYFFGNSVEIQQQPVINSGSGVIISSDGYIVTNNHVIEGSDQIEVILNDQNKYKAKLVGADARTDVALLKIEGENLPFMTYGNSDELKVGEWVLALGNPFNLNSTVTAGIVSAKARNINILSNYSIESFIQFDAAVNPGNSGGALINTRGELVGINTAIASSTGTFVGYSFAIPVNIVKKIINDFIEFGEVQRAYLGVTPVDLNADNATSLGVEDKKGVYIKEVTKGSSADEAGIENGDIIQSIGGYTVESVPQLHEQISKYRPGDKVEVEVRRNSNVKKTVVTLKNRNGTTDIIKNEKIEVMGVALENISTADMQRLRLKYGAKITDLKDGVFRSAGIKKGFIITKINRQPVYTAGDAKSFLESADGGVVVEGYYPNGIVAYYTFEL